MYVDTSSSMYRIPLNYAEKLIRSYGVDHVLFGSDYPMWNSKDELEYIDRLNLTHEEKELILHGNAERILNLK